MSRDFIDLEKRNNYGNDAWYVVSHQAEPIKDLTGRKTVTPADVRALENLGFEFFCSDCRKELMFHAGSIVHREE